MIVVFQNHLALETPIISVSSCIGKDFVTFLFKKDGIIDFMVLTAIVFLLILSVLVLIHEAGHFFMAKRFGIKVEEFGFGLPLLPKIFSFKRGETEYSIYPALIGGFVKLYGEDEAGAGRISLRGKDPTSLKLRGASEGRAFYSRPVWQRAIVVVAGVVMNVFLGVVIYYTFMFVGNFKTQLPVYPPGGQVPNFILVNQKIDTKIIIATVAKGSPAEKTGITPVSQIISVNGVGVSKMDYFLKVIKENKGKKIVLEWQDLKTNKKSVSILVPRINPPKNEGALGISFFPSQTINMNYDTPAQKVLSGFTHPTNLMVYNYVILKQLVSSAIAQRNVELLSQGVSGPVGIATVVSAVLDIPNLREKILELLNLAGILSISLAFFNVLPIPGLDGGRLFFILAEGIFGVKMSLKVEGYVNTIGMAFLFLLIILITYKDIMQQFVK